MWSSNVLICYSSRWIYGSESIKPELFTFLTIIISALVACVMLQQYRLSKEKFKLDMFEKRFSVYKGAQVFLTCILVKAKFEMNELFEFRAKTQDSVFLFGEDIVSYLKQIDSKALELGTSQEILEGERDTERRKPLIDKKTNSLEWLIDQLPELKNKFAPYLKFKNWK
jgi:hypothetical protein